MYKPIAEFLSGVEERYSEIKDSRKKVLTSLSDYLRSELDRGNTARLTFICTHNSRRSMFGQLWAAAAAHFFGIEGIETFSGGTEATAFNPRAVAAIRRAGFKVEDPGGENPHYHVFFDDNAPSIESFSKTYDDSYNPQENFAAVMTCSEADHNCPFIPGASLRVSIPYRDPKEADDTPEEEQVYDERCRQIAMEMCFMMSLV